MLNSLKQTRIFFIQILLNSFPINGFELLNLGDTNCLNQHRKMNGVTVDISDNSCNDVSVAIQDDQGEYLALKPMLTQDIDTNVKLGFLKNPDEWCPGFYQPSSQKYQICLVSTKEPWYVTKGYFPFLNNKLPINQFGVFRFRDGALLSNWPGDSALEFPDMYLCMSYYRGDKNKVSFVQYNPEDINDYNTKCKLEGLYFEYDKERNRISANRLNGAEKKYQQRKNGDSAYWTIVSDGLDFVKLTPKMVTKVTSGQKLLGCMAANSAASSQDTFKAITVTEVGNKSEVSISAEFKTHMEENAFFEDASLDITLAASLTASVSWSRTTTSETDIVLGGGKEGYVYQVFAEGTDSGYPNSISGSFRTLDKPQIPSHKCQVKGEIAPVGNLPTRFMIRDE